MLTVQVDKTAPTATLSTSLSAAQPTNAATLPISLNFSEAVDGLSLDDLVIGNGTASNLAGNTSAKSVLVGVGNVAPTANAETFDTIFDWEVDSLGIKKLDV